jgi:hypothetical protein
MTCSCSSLVVNLVVKGSGGFGDSGGGRRRGEVVGGLKQFVDLVGEG